MQKIKFFLIGAILMLSYASYAQEGDFEINVDMIPSTLILGQRGIFQAKLINNGATPYPSRTVTATLQAPVSGKIIGLSPDSAPGWAIDRIIDGKNPGGGGNTAKLINTDPIESLRAKKVKLIIEAVAVDIPSEALGNVGYYVKAGQNNAIYGNMNAQNDNSSVGLEVIAGILPVNFVSINATWNNQNGDISWIVANESNNQYFVVERSFDGANFVEAGRVNSIGDHDNKATYKFSDIGIKGKTSTYVYYRVRQVDFDTKTTVSRIVSLNTSGTDKKASLFPNPVVNERLSFTYQDANLMNDYMDIQILDARGRIVQKTGADVLKGKNVIEIKNLNLASGLYYLSYSSKLNNVQGVLQFVKQ